MRVQTNYFRIIISTPLVTRIHTRAIVYSCLRHYAAFAAALADGITQECPRDVHFRSRPGLGRSWRVASFCLMQLAVHTDGEFFCPEADGQDRIRERQSCGACVFVRRRSQTKW